MSCVIDGEFMKNHLLFVAILTVNIVALYMIFIWAPPEKTLGDSYRVFFIHTPSAWVSYLSFTITFFSSLFYLRTSKVSWDQYAATSSTLGILFSTVTLITGSIWAKIAWGLYWNWDPRETSTLVLLMAYLAYASLRMAVTERDRRARISAVLGILIFATIPLSYLSTVFWATLHPMLLLPTSNLQLGAAPPILLTLVVSTFGATLLFLGLFYLTLTTYQLTEITGAALLENEG
jgi:heme exporter protein C